MLDSFDPVQQLRLDRPFLCLTFTGFEEFTMSEKITKQVPGNDDERWADEDTQEFVEPDVPVEHYYGEKNRSQPEETGDLDEETLDPSAPFNKTYGRHQGGNSDQR